MRQSLYFLKPFLLFIVAVLVFLTVSRAGLVFWQFDRVNAADGLFIILLQGMRFDLVLMGLLLFIPLTLTPLVLMFNKAKQRWMQLVTIYLSVCFIAIVFIELSTPSFINQFDLRPNVLFIEYLKYPREVLSTLWSAYRLQLIFTVLFTVLSVYWLYKRLKAGIGTLPLLKFKQAIVLAPLLFFACLMMTRSTLDKRPVNPSTVAFSSDPLVNTLALNSAYSVLYAFNQMMQESAAAMQYGKMDEKEVVSIVRQGMHIDENQFEADQYSTKHHQQPTFKRDRPLNLVIILEESLGAEFVGSLGGKPLTDNLDRLAEQGIWFENLYATGTRSVRGIEAVVTGFTPTPMRSVVKLNKSQTGFFTVARLLKEKGYETSFIYGGEAHFDNMKSFFANNGFEKVVDEKDYLHPVFTGAWGVSDEDLFNKAHEEFLAYGDDKPFFSLVFTSSNHSPFEFPAHRINLYDQQVHTVNNAVKYADYALGQFIEKARQSSYWDNTVFLIVADHNSRVYGDELVPIERFHIPGLILGGKVKPEHVNKLASQIDLLPTVLSIMGIEADHPAIGHDLTRPVFANIPGRAIMQFASTQAYMLESGEVVIMEKNKQPAQYIYDHHHLKPVAKRDGKLVKTALGHSIWSLHAYQQQRYH